MEMHSESPPVTPVSWDELIILARGLPAQLAVAYAREHAQCHSTHANQQEEAISRLIDVTVSMWVSLVATYPSGHFKGNDPEAFLRAYLDDRLTWRSLLVREDVFDPMRSLELKRAVLSDAEEAVADTVRAIFRGDDRVMLNLWADWWRDAKSVRELPLR